MSSDSDEYFSPSRARTLLRVPRAPIPRDEPDDPPETRPALEEAKKLARSAEDDIVTQQRCPLCCGHGMVPPEIAITFDALCIDARKST